MTGDASRQSYIWAMTSSDDAKRRDVMDTETRQIVRRPGVGSDPRRPVLTLAFHPDSSRIGARAGLTDLLAKAPISISRTTPNFVGPVGFESAPIADPYVSRRPLRLEPAGADIRLVPGGSPVVVDGVPVTDPLTVRDDQIERGVVIELAERVVLLLHKARPTLSDDEDLGIVGESDAIRDARAEIRRAAALDSPVLVRGETGTGKELVATALHTLSNRGEGPFVAINAATFSPSTAAAELFGHVRGAFTGATRDSRGLWATADHGTLFLDEIGAAPSELQAMLLRVLETGEVRPVGSNAARRYNVRLVAATDANLEEAIERQEFRAPLMHRLAAFRVDLPPLRERRSDIPRLLVHFLREELEAAGRGETLRMGSPYDDPWLGPDVVLALLDYAWPGNVRELRNVARRIASGTGRRAEVPWILLTETSASGLNPPPPDTDAGPKPRKTKQYRDPSEVNEEELRDALKEHDWHVGKAAKALGVSRASAYALIDAATTIRKARDVTDAEIIQASAECGGAVRQMAHLLEVSERGLRLRLRKFEGDQEETQ